MKSNCFALSQHLLGGAEKIIYEDIRIIIIPVEIRKESFKNTSWNGVASPNLFD
jgi:hypothetical protein